jgi:hypothetical protein
MDCSFRLRCFFRRKYEFFFAQHSACPCTAEVSGERREPPAFGYTGDAVSSLKSFEGALCLEMTAEAAASQPKIRAWGRWPFLDLAPKIIGSFAH